MSDAAQLLAEATRAVREGRIAEAETLYNGVLASQPDNAEALRGLAAIEFQSGRYDAAELKTRRLLELRPDDPAIHFSLGVVLQRRGRLDDAGRAYQSALAINPAHVRALIALGEVYRLQTRFDETASLARTALRIEPSNGDACNLLGAALQGRGETAEAVAWFERAAACRPEDARALYNLGVALQALRRTDEAEAAYRRAVRADPGLMEARNNLGLLLVDADKGEDAVEHLRVAADLAPGSAIAHNNLGRALYASGRLDDAWACFERALHLVPNYAEALTNMGAVQRLRGRPEAALASFDRALSLQPGFADAHGNRSMVLLDLGRLDEAAESARQAIAGRPDEAEFHMALALAHNDRGLHRDALESCRRAMALKQGSATLHRRMLGLLLYNREATAAKRFVVARAFGTQFGPRLSRAAPDDRRRDPLRRLRIGYVSSDLRGNHPVARNLRPIVAHHDRSSFEVFVYADVSASDQTTDTFKALADGWRSIEGLSDGDVAAAIRNDQIDVLVILAGRFDRNRPLVATYRPAPAQISLFDAATSGLEGMDYLIADHVMVPSNSPERFTERVIRVPHFYVHEPLDDAPPVRRLPMLRGGAPTFGCFNNPAKLGDECLALWARLLTEVPSARLVLKFRNWYRSEVLRSRVNAAFDRAGVARERLRIVEADEPGRHHLEIYNEIDVALDPFPFNGSTTTFEALWLGVPVVTLAGDTLMSRWTASMLSALKLDHLAARTPDDYVRRAAELVADPPALAALRENLRGRVAASPLCDGRRRARQVERLYRAAWRRRVCASAR